MEHQVAPTSARLPSEIEQEIFEWAVQISPSSSRSFMLVAHRVHEWIATSLYKISQQILVPHSPPRTPNSYGHSPSVDYFGKFVKHLMLGGPHMRFDELSHYLEACPNLVDLALWSHHPTKPFLDTLDKMSLQRLSTNLTSLDEEDFKRPAFLFITHLDITALQGEGDWTRWQYLIHLPRLTHILINEVVEVRVINNLLKHCNQLRILVIVDHGTPWNLGNIEIHDPRFVMMKLERYVTSDWENAANGRPHIWSYAEAISLAKTHERLNKELFRTWFTEHGWPDELRNQKATSQPTGERSAG